MQARIQTRIMHCAGNLCGWEHAINKCFKLDFTNAKIGIVELAKLGTPKLCNELEPIRKRRRVAIITYHFHRRGGPDPQMKGTLARVIWTICKTQPSWDPSFSCQPCVLLLVVATAAAAYVETHLQLKLS